MRTRSREPRPKKQAAAAPARWKNRIVGQRDVAPEEITENDKNWREHPVLQHELMAEALDEVGWVQRIVFNVRTGRLVDGHLRLRLAIQRKEPTVPVLDVDLSEDEEALVLATLDPIGALASMNHVKAQELLDSIDEEMRNRLRGLELLSRKLMDPDSPEHKAGDRPAASFSIMVDCDNEDQQRELLARFEEEGLKCRALIY